MRNGVVAALSVAGTLAVCVLVSVLMASKTGTDSVFGAALRFRGTTDTVRRLPLQAGGRGGGQAAAASQPSSTATATPAAAVPGTARQPHGADSDVKDTVQRCSRMEAWGDVCVYENICYGNGRLKFVTSTTGEGQQDYARTCAPTSCIIAT